VDVQTWGVDLLSMCAHKLYGPKGIGALYVRKRRPRIGLQPLLRGGGQEGGLRSGTLPVPLIAGFAKAVDLCLEGGEAETARLASLRDELWRQLSESLDGVARNGHPTRRLSGNLNVSFAGVEADQLLVGLADVALSTGSACSSASAEPSHVLKALGLSDEVARASLRIGIGRDNTSEQIDWVAKRLIDLVGSLRQARASGASSARRP
jgi:cysteine desulfurase